MITFLEHMTWSTPTQSELVPVDLNDPYLGHVARNVGVKLYFMRETTIPLIILYRVLGRRIIWREHNCGNTNTVITRC